MAIRKIAQIGHPVLRNDAEPVLKKALKTRLIQGLIDDLIATMRDANGAGLAATQIYEPVQICALEVDGNPRYPYKPKIPLTVLVNPQIEILTDETFANYEGCLSVPNLRGVVERPSKIRLTALDRNGKEIRRTFKGFTAGTIQHEVDHLFGKLFVDRVKDPKTLTTWAEFDRHHKARFLKHADLIKRRFH